MMEGAVFELEPFAAACGVADCAGFVEHCTELYRLLIEANRQVNLTRITDPDGFLIKHVADSLLLARAFPEVAREKLRIADIGCGAGFPSLVLALAFPQLKVCAIDSIAKKTNFVRSAGTALGLKNLEVVTGRSRELDFRPEFRNRFDIVTARAVAEGRTIYLDARHFPRQASGRFIFYKTPEQAAEDLPSLRSCKEPRRWDCSEVFMLPQEAGRRCFIFSVR